jgi:hypothetical protein
MMNMKLYGLLSRKALTASNGKTYKAASCMAVAETEQDARSAAIKDDPYGLNWRDTDLFACVEASSIGAPPPPGYVSYAVCEDGK